MTAKPEEGADTEGTSKSPDLDAVGDSHMPEDLREAERDKADEEGERPEAERPEAESER